jgi:hypothetical protein
MILYKLYEIIQGEVPDNCYMNKYINLFNFLAYKIYLIFYYPTKLKIYPLDGLVNLPVFVEILLNWQH